MLQIANACSLDLARCHMCIVALINESPMYRRENAITFFTGTEINSTVTLKRIKEPSLKLGFYH